MQDAVDRLTPLGVMVLALLREGDMHPYEMMRLMRQRRDDRLVADHERHVLPHRRAARAGGAPRRGGRRSRRQPSRAHDLCADGCRPSAVVRTGCAASCRASTTRPNSASRSPRRTTSTADEVIALLGTRRDALAAAHARDRHADVEDADRARRARAVPPRARTRRLRCSTPNSPGSIALLAATRRPTSSRGARRSSPASAISTTERPHDYDRTDDAAQPRASASAAASTRSAARGPPCGRSSSGSS